MNKLSNSVNKNKKISFHLTQVESDMLETLLRDKNETSWKHFNKSELIRELIVNEFKEKYKYILIESGLNIEDVNELLFKLSKIGVENIARKEF